MWRKHRPDAYRQTTVTQQSRASPVASVDAYGKGVSYDRLVAETVQDGSEHPCEVQTLTRIILNDRRAMVMDEYIQLFVEWLCEIVANSDETQTEIIDIIDRIRDGQIKAYIETKQRLRGTEQEDL